MKIYDRNVKECIGLNERETVDQQNRLAIVEDSEINIANIGI